MSEPVNGTDAGTLAEAKAAAGAGYAADQSWRAACSAGAGPEQAEVGTPHLAEIRQVRPAAEMGAGYREAEDGVPR